MNLLCIGHCCHDLVSGDYKLGGTASYAAAIAAQYDIKTSILTSTGRDFLFDSFFAERGISFHNILSAETTVFENIYETKGRTQYLRATAEPILSYMLPDELKRNDTVLLCPIANEISSEILSAFDKKFIALTAQGLLRKKEESGLISFQNIDWEKWSVVDIVFLSIEDIGYDEQIVKEIIEHISHLIITYGDEGAIIYKNGNRYHYPSFPAEEIDATGAGDSFTMAYLIHYLSTEDVASSCIQAHCAASLVIEQKGTEHFSSKEEIAVRVNRYSEIFDLP
jgi:ribokinase